MKNGWLKQRIDDICVFRGGGTPSKSKESYWKGDIPWVSPKDMKSDIITDSVDHISAEAVEQSTTNLIPANSILIVVRSGILARTIPVAITGCDVTINQDIKALCPNSNVDAWFLF
jgi:type I restriction enzyme, S subunit